MAQKRIIILGGGFAGVKCAQTLSRQLSRDEAEIVLFNAENHLVFTPLLADVIGASVNPLDVVVPLRQLLPDVHCRTEEVTAIHPEANEIEYHISDGQTCRLAYDHLVLACGNVANLHAVPGMADHAFPLKNIGDAIALRSHVMEQMEKAETCSEVERRRWFLSFVIVGAGYSGVEAAGEINDLVRNSARYFQNFRAEDVTVTLIHSRDQILPEIANGLREFARRKMEHAGVKILLNARVASAAAEGVALAGGEFVRGGTVVCTVGSSPAPILERLAAPKEKGRLLTDADMRVRGTANVWATGDCANVLNAHDGQPSPPTGQFAERQGRQCALNIARDSRRADATVLLQAARTALFDWRSFSGGGISGRSALGLSCVAAVARRLSFQVAVVGAALPGRIRLGLATPVSARPCPLARAPDGPRLARALPARRLDYPARRSVRGFLRRRKW